MLNGESGFCTCGEPGRKKQGTGHTRCYPHREPKERFPLRDSDDIKYNLGPKALLLGGLTSMPWFDVVLGIVPDYRHGVLMGITKTLLSKWFSPPKSNNQFLFATI